MSFVDIACDRSLVDVQSRERAVIKLYQIARYAMLGSAVWAALALAAVLGSWWVVWKALAVLVLIVASIGCGWWSLGCLTRARAVAVEKSAKPVSLCKVADRVVRTKAPRRARGTSWSERMGVFGMLEASLLIACVAFVVVLAAAGMHHARERIKDTAAQETMIHVR